jgi:glycosyltransferase involved in cell wall biosynthesis
VINKSLISVKKLAIVTTHPIQYNAPFFASLGEAGICQLKVFYTWGQSETEQVFDPGFGSSFKWDLPLLEGYDYEFLENNAQNPGSSHFNGIINPHILSVLQNWNPDAILIYGWCFHSHLKVMRYFSGKIPIWFRGDSTLLDESNGFSVKKIIRRLFLRWVYSHVDLCFYVGKENRRYFEAHGLKPKQLIFAPHAIDNERFQTISADETKSVSEWKINLGIDSNDLVFLFCGKLEPKKMPDLLVKSFIKMHNKKRHLIIVGDGLMKDELKQLAKQNSNVHFIGFQNQTLMPLIYRLCDVFVLPSKGPGETWGLAINEAMACGKPVISSTSCGATSDLIDQGINGWSIEPCNEDGMLSVLEKAIHLGKEQLNQLGKNASSKIIDYSYSNFLSAINFALNDCSNRIHLNAIKIK